MWARKFFEYMYLNEVQIYNTKRVNYGIIFKRLWRQLSSVFAKQAYLKPSGLASLRGGKEITIKVFFSKYQ